MAAGFTRKPAKSRHSGGKGRIQVGQKAMGEPPDHRDRPLADVPDLRARPILPVTIRTDSGWLLTVQKRPL